MRWWRWGSRYSPDAVGLALLAVVSFGISLKFAFDMPLLWGDDERAHAGYAIAVWHGDLPTIHTPVLDDPTRFPALSASLDGWQSVGRQIWVANHPPLYYLLTAPLVALGEWLGVPAAGLVAMRVVNAAGTAANVVLVGLIARELLPHRRSVALLAAALAASASTLAMEGGYGYNDGLAALAGSATLLSGVRMLRRGPSRRLLVAAAIAGTAAAGLKAPNLVAVAACTAMAAVAVLLHVPRHRWRRALGAAALVGGVPAFGFGWFYLRNLRLYGDLTGAEALFAAFGRRSRATVWETLTSVEFHRTIVESLWIRPGYDPHLRPIPDALFLAAALGLVVLLVSWLRARYARPPSLPSEQPFAVRTGLAVAWCVVLGHAALVYLLLVQFRAGGGYLSPRYLLPVMPVVATVLAVGVMRLAEVVPTPDRRRWPAMVATLVSTGMLGLAFVAYRASMASVERSVKIPGLEGPAVGGPAPALALGLAAAAALGYVVLAARRVLEPAPAPADPEFSDGTDSERAHHLTGGAPVRRSTGSGSVGVSRRHPLGAHPGELGVGGELHRDLH